MPKAVQRASPLALAFPFCGLPNLSRRVLVWRSEATPLVYAKHTPRCQTVLIDINCCNLFYSNISPIRIQVKLAGDFGQGGDQFIFISIVRIDELADFRGVIPHLQIGKSRFRIVTRGSGTD